MSNFDWLTDWDFSRHVDQCGKMLNGDVVYSTKSPFSVPAMDAGFDFSIVLTQEVQNLAKEKGYDLHHIFLFTAFHSNLKRKSTSLRTEVELYFLKKDEEINAFIFLGANLEEIKP